MMNCVNEHRVAASLVPGGIPINTTARWCYEVYDCAVCNKRPKENPALDEIPNGYYTADGSFISFPIFGEYSLTTIPGEFRDD